MPRNPHCSRHMVQKAGKPTEVTYTSRLPPMIMTRDSGHNKSLLAHQRYVASWVITVILSQHSAPHNRAPTTGHIDWLAATCHYQWTCAMLTWNSAPSPASYAGGQWLRKKLSLSFMRTTMLQECTVKAYDLIPWCIAALHADQTNLPKSEQQQHEAHSSGNC